MSRRPLTEAVLLIASFLIPTSVGKHESCGTANGKANLARKLIACAVLVLANALLLVAQVPPQCDSIEFLVKMGELTSNLLPNGITAADSLIVLPDGRFHLQRRFQKLPGRTATVKIFESSLNEKQLEELRVILESASLKELSPYRKPSFPLNADTFGFFEANIRRGSKIEKVGYWEWRGGIDGTPPNSSPDEMKKVWRDSRKALEPLVDWFHGVEALKLRSSTDAKSMLCTGE